VRLAVTERKNCAFCETGRERDKKNLQVEIHVFLECGSVILLVDPVPCPTLDWKNLGFNPV
jgi:hypothetical protein